MISTWKDDQRHESSGRCSDHQTLQQSKGIKQEICDISCGWARGSKTGDAQTQLGEYRLLHPLWKTIQQFHKEVSTYLYHPEITLKMK